MSDFVIYKELDYRYFWATEKEFASPPKIWKARKPKNKAAMAEHGRKQRRSPTEQARAEFLFWKNEEKRRRRNMGDWITAQENKWAAERRYLDYLQGGT